MALATGGTGSGNGDGSIPIVDPPTKYSYALQPEIVEKALANLREILKRLIPLLDTTGSDGLGMEGDMPSLPGGRPGEGRPTPGGGRPEGRPRPERRRTLAHRIEYLDPHRYPNLLPWKAGATEYPLRIRGIHFEPFSLGDTCNSIWIIHHHGLAAIVVPEVDDSTRAAKLRAKAKLLHAIYVHVYAVITTPGAHCPFLDQLERELTQIYTAAFRRGDYEYVGPDELQIGAPLLVPPGPNLLFMIDAEHPLVDGARIDSTLLLVDSPPTEVQSVGAPGGGALQLVVPEGAHHPPQQAVEIVGRHFFRQSYHPLSEHFYVQEGVDSVVLSRVDRPEAYELFAQKDSPATLENGLATITYELPPQLLPGEYEVRVVTRFGGASSGGPTLHVQAPAQGPPRVDGLAPAIVANDRAVEVRLEGQHLAGAQEVLLRAFGPDPVPISLGAPTGAGEDLLVTLRGGGALEPGGYDVIVRGAAGENDHSLAKLVVTEPDPTCLLGSLEEAVCLLALDERSALFRTPALVALIHDGQLCWLRDERSRRVLVSRTSTSDRHPKGVGSHGFQGPAKAGPGIVLGEGPDELIGGAEGLELQSTQPILDAQGDPVGLTFLYEGVLSRMDGSVGLRVHWSLEAAADGSLDGLRLELEYDAASAQAQVHQVWCCQLGIAPGLRHLVAVSGGLALDWPELNVNRNYDQPEHFDAPVVLLEHDRGSLWIDATGLATTNDFLTFHRQDADRATQLSFRATSKLDGLSAGALGSILLRVSDRHWSELADEVSNEIQSTGAPAWQADLGLVVSAVGLNDGADVFASAEALMKIEEDVVADVPPRLLPPGGFPKDHRLLFATDAHDSGSPKPDFPIGETFSHIAGTLQDLGWKVMPWYHSVGLEGTHREYPVLDGDVPIEADNVVGTTRWAVNRMSRWIKGSDVRNPRFRYWDVPQFPMGFTLGRDFWTMSLGFPDWRAVTVGNLLAAQESYRSFNVERRRFDGVYLDYCKANLHLDDRQSHQASAPEGFRLLCAELRAAFTAPDSTELAIAGEGTSRFMLESGQTQHATHVVATGSLEIEPLGDRGLVSLAHPFASLMLGPHDRSFATLDQGEPGVYPLHHAVVQRASVLQGVLPTAGLLYVHPSRGVSRCPSTRRALVAHFELGLWWRLFHVRTARPGVDDIEGLWREPGVAHVFLVDSGPSGAQLVGGQPRPTAWTERFVLQKLVCDLYWQFGGVAPTQAEVDEELAQTPFDAVSIMAAATRVRIGFQESPTPEDRLLTRREFRERVSQLDLDLPYPVPHDLARLG